LENANVRETENMTTVAINSKYVDILTPLGDVQQAVDEAVRRYAVEKLGERLAELRHTLRPFEERYGCPYEVFYARVTTDEDFVAGLREVNPTWERDFHTWEFYVEELREWLNRLEQLSML
jgi:hypothetical protein